MTKKWYNLFVSVDQPGETAAENSPAEAVADIASRVPPETKFTSQVKDPASFDEIYSAAEITLPIHGYTILKVAEMLASEHIRTQPQEVKRSSILVALDAAGVKLPEVIEDAVRRDRALDTYERVQQKALETLEAQKNEENRQIQAEVDRLVAEHRARIQANDDQVAKEKEYFYGWRLKKQQEEKRIADAVSYFVAENPITTSGPEAAPPPTRTAKG